MGSAVSLALFRFVRPLLWTVGRTGGKIIADIAKNTSPDVSAEDIISEHVGDVTERRLFSKLRGRGLKRVKQEKRGRKKAKKTPSKRDRVIKRDIFS